MDGGTLFKEDITNRICNEMLKRNREEEFWYYITIESRHWAAPTDHFKWDDELNCWIVRKVSYSTKITDDQGTYRRWETTYKCLYCDHLRNFFNVINKLEILYNKEFIDSDEDEEYEIRLYLKCQDESLNNWEMYSQEFVSPKDVVDYMVTMAEFAKCGFRSNKSFKESKKIKN